MVSKVFPVLVAIISLVTLHTVHASDPDILTDFVVPQGVTVNSSSFTFTGLRQTLWGGPRDSSPFKVTKATEVEFPLLTGQGVSLAVLQYAPSAINPPHTHPRSAELLLVLQGWLHVGLVDSNNKLFTQVLRTGDLFLFPKGLVHFQENVDSQYPAVAISGFGSANAGTVALTKALFSSGIDAEVLAKSFKTDTKTMKKLVLANKD